MRETKYTAIVLKKQAFGEADEIITFFTKEAGKVRGLAKSVKKQKSKLQHALQGLFYIKLTLASRKTTGLKKIIGAEVLETFPLIRENLHLAKAAWYALEIVYKGTADEHKNEKMFSLLFDFLKYLNQPKLSSPVIDAVLVKLKILFLEYSGLAVHYPKGNLNLKNLYFSNHRGGFFEKQEFSDLQVIAAPVFKNFLVLKTLPFDRLADFKGETGVLQKLLSGFLEYQLERQIKAGKYLEV